MLLPVLIRSNYKVEVATPTTLGVENLVASVLPLQDCKIMVHNRSTSAGSVSVTITRTSSFENQSDSDFDGLVTTTPVAAVTVANGTSLTINLGDAVGALLQNSSGVTHSMVVSNLGAVDPALISFEILGVVESAVGVNRQVVVNV